MSNLIGSGADQVPTNGMLGTAAFVDVGQMPVSTPQADALVLKADAANAALTGVPTAPTAAIGTNTTQLATMAAIIANAASATPSALGTAAVGAGTRHARDNHVHAMPTLDALANTTITSNATGEVLKWNGTAWINNTLVEAGIASSGANSTITSLTGLTTDLSIAQGGTGSSTATAACTALGAYQKSSILGTVSQSAGVPTGALMEYISNANGEAWRYAGGMQVCTSSRALSTVGVVNNNVGAYGWSFYAQTEVCTYPATFIAAPTVSAGAGTLPASSGIGGLASVEGVDTMTVQVTAWSHTSDVRTVKYTATGRWF